MGGNYGTECMHLAGDTVVVMGDHNLYRNDKSLRRETLPW
jgi:hypothetical protein